MAFESENRRGVANGGIAGFMTLGRLGVLNKLQAHSSAIGSLTSDGIDGVEQDADGMPSTNGIAVFLQVGAELGGIHGLDNVHPLAVEMLDRLPDGFEVVVDVLVVEPGSPMAEVGRDDEHVGGVVEVFGENPAILAFFGHGQPADENRYYGELIPEIFHHFGDVR